MADSHDDVVVIGIDPAPGKDTVVCADVFADTDHGKSPCFAKWPANKVKENLENWCKSAKEKQKKLLITWDAPLTGPSNQGNVKEWNRNFTQRMIERLFTNAQYFNSSTTNVKGISVLGYSGCSHWTLSQHTLGLPVISEYHTPIDNLPYTLVKNDATNVLLPCDHFLKNYADKPLVAEVHPALAMWVFLNGHKEAPKNLFQNDRCTEPCNNCDKCNDGTLWYYKGKQPKTKEHPTCIPRRLEALKKCFCEKMKSLPENFHEAILDADHLDAYIAWLLGKLWVNSALDDPKEDGVQLVGTLATGAMLLPQGSAINESLKKLVSHENPSETRTS